MKEELSQLLEQARETLIRDEVLPAEARELPIQVERTRDRQHGDFACNLAMMLAKPARRNPREIATALTEALPASEHVAKVEIAGPGFINFFLTPAAWHAVVDEVFAKGAAYGRSDIGKDEKILLEFVSANPTGPLHVGHGRGAAYGSTVGNLLEAIGHPVHREYYVNDAGRQMDILAASIWLRYLEAGGEAIAFPSNGYKGDYIVDIAAKLREAHGERFMKPANEVFDGLPADEPAGGDKEEYIDAVIARARELLGAADFDTVFKLGLDDILDDIREDLEGFGTTFDEWFSERSLTENKLVEHALEVGRERGDIYEKDGALWFRAEKYGDEKDRVVVRDNGQTTYFASDIAYHLNKRERGYDRLIDILGADHHGYIARLKAGLEGMGQPGDSLEVRLVQFAHLYRGKEKLQMSTRSGSFVTLRELREEVGADAARYFYVMRSNDQHLDFDLELAKSQSSDNPVYYVQYAHARICSVFAQAAEKGFEYSRDTGLANLDQLDEPHEDQLMVSLSRYPEVVEAAARNRAPHLLTQYLRDLANDLHTYYNAHTFLVMEEELRNARLALVEATRQVLANGLGLIGVSTPESM
ncbi:arginine--tRNA ligase [Natronospira bacteriovora]|uniref:Arginine--tRNA ligase n=1 Tax=Natronospira bacteriovora TaxID=3069753 RepID=A0ABU0W7D4_9GAMM|nr:arginine--tRNA ligase [Natronospira sp. AB-CW4]MDQ2069933.1 arginine--tRNA ligase [Natronospira sp. AB-CW4]